MLGMLDRLNVQEVCPIGTYMRWSCQPVSTRAVSLIAEEKTSIQNIKIWLPSNLVPKYLCCSYLSEFPWHIMSKLHGLFFRCQFVSKTGIKMPFLGVVHFKSLYYIYQKIKPYSTWCILCGLNNLSGFEVLKYSLPYFLA